MKKTFTIENFDARVTSLRESHGSKDLEFRKLKARAVQTRLRAILDEPFETTIDGEKVTLPALELMTREMVELVLGKGQFVGVKDRDRIQAFKVLMDRVYGAPKQVVELQRSETVTQSDELESLDDDDLEQLQKAYENVLSTPVRKTLG